MKTQSFFKAHWPAIIAAVLLATFFTFVVINIVNHWEFISYSLKH